jgi:hypothetical protein
VDPSASIVRFHGDGLSLTPSETAALLQKLTASSDFVPDRYRCWTASESGNPEQLLLR